MKHKWGVGWIIGVTFGTIGVIYLAAITLGGYPLNVIVEILEAASPTLSLISVGLGVYSIRQANSSSAEATKMMTSVEAVQQEEAQAIKQLAKLDEQQAAMLSDLENLLSGVKSFMAQQDAISRGLDDIKESLMNTSVAQPPASSEEATATRPWSGADMAEEAETAQ